MVWEEHLLALANDASALYWNVGGIATLVPDMKL